MAETFENSPAPKSKRRRIVDVLIIFGSSIGVAFCLYSLLYQTVFQERLWKSKVQPQMNFAATRAWALGVLKLADHTEPYMRQQDFLTNAPTCLLKHYKRNPDVLVDGVCVTLRYGGGMYSWGLIIGNTNLPPLRVSGTQVEQWAPGIYYWSNYVAHR